MGAAHSALELAPKLLSGLEFNKASMKKAISAEMFATDIAIQHAAEGVPFRQAYLDAKEAVDSMTEVNPEKSLSDRVSLGGCANLGLDVLRSRLDAN